MLKNKNGFTLIEVIISVAILGLISILFTSMMGTSLRMNQNALKRTAESMLASGQVDRGLSREGQSAELVINFNKGRTVKVEGYNLVSKDSEEVSYSCFVPVKVKNE